MIKAFSNSFDLIWCCLRTTASKDSKEEIYVLLTYPSSLYLSANFKTLWTIKGSGNKQTYFKPTFWNTCPFRGDFSSVVKVFQSRVPSPSMSSQCRRIISDIHSDIKVSVFHYLLSKSNSCLTFSFWMIMNVALCQPSKIGDIIDPQLPMAKNQQDPTPISKKCIFFSKKQSLVLP